jgi:hypothetical protein
MFIGKKVLVADADGLDPTEEIDVIVSDANEQETKSLFKTNDKLKFKKPKKDNV